MESHSGRLRADFAGMLAVAAASFEGRGLSSIGWRLLAALGSVPALEESVELVRELAELTAVLSQLDGVLVTDVVTLLLPVGVEEVELVLVEAGGGRLRFLGGLPLLRFTGGCSWGWGWGWASFVTVSDFSVAFSSFSSFLGRSSGEISADASLCLSPRVCLLRFLRFGSDTNATVFELERVTGLRLRSATGEGTGGACPSEPDRDRVLGL